MNIHFISGERVDTAKFRRLTKLKLDRSGTKEPRTREGIGNVPNGSSQKMGARITASAVYPGGKTLRRRMARLAVRQAAHDRDYAPGVKGGKGVNGEGYMTKPGSYK